MRILAIIPARGGSKRIERKNIKDFAGKPIIAYSIEAALGSGCFDRVMVSTDDREIADVSCRYGAEVPFMRSDRTSDDFATTADVILEVLDRYAERGEQFDAVACIYATAPFVTTDRLRAAAGILERGEAKAAFTCVEYSYPVQRSLFINGSGRIAMRYPEYAGARSQDLEKTYHDAGQFYFTTVAEFRACGSLWGPDTMPIVLSELEVQDLDTLTDWKLAEMKYGLLHGTDDRKERQPIFPGRFRVDSYECIPYTDMDAPLSEAMLAGRNDPEVRIRMVNRDPVTREEHENFIVSLRARSDRQYYAVTDRDGAVVGSFNMTLTAPGRMERGIWIAAGQRGHGHARRLMKAVYDYFRKECGTAVIETRVRIDNEASRALEKALGAVAVDEDGEYIRYETAL